MIARAINTINFKAVHSRVTIVPPALNRSQNDTLKRIWGDPQRYVQVLINLLSNAIKFSKAGSQVEVRVDTRPLEANKITLRLSVRDHGVGISPENI